MIEFAEALLLTSPISQFQSSLCQNFSNRCFTDPSPSKSVLTNSRRHWLSSKVNNSLNHLNSGNICLTRPLWKRCQIFHIALFAHHSISLSIHSRDYSRCSWDLRENRSVACYVKNEPYLLLRNKNSWKQTGIIFDHVIPCSSAFHFYICTQEKSTYIPGENVYSIEQCNTTNNQIPGNNQIPIHSRMNK